MRDTTGNITMWIGSNTDIHEQKEKEEELRRANDDLQQFAYSASHDLQEPIRNVAVYSEIVAKRYATCWMRKGGSSRFPDRGRPPPGHADSRSAGLYQGRNLERT